MSDYYLANKATLDAVTYCQCAKPALDVELDAACRRCGRPVNYAPDVPTVREADL